MADCALAASGIPSAEADDYSDAAWMLLGSLNSGRVDTVPPERLRAFVERAATLPLRQAYPILAWIIRAHSEYAAGAARAACQRAVWALTSPQMTHMIGV